MFYRDEDVESEYEENVDGEELESGVVSVYPEGRIADDLEALSIETNTLSLFPS